MELADIVKGGRPEGMETPEDRRNNVVEVAFSGNENGNGSEEEELDFSKESIFSDVSGSERIPIPGLRDSYIEVRRSVPYQVSTGRTRFANQQTTFETDAKGRRNIANQILLSYDIFGLFVYKFIHCLSGWRILDPETGRFVEYNGNERHSEATARKIRSSKLCQWMVDEIDRVLGWNEEGESSRKTFSEETT